MKKVKTILLVEDDADDQEFFINALKEVEPESVPEVANNGIDALYKLRNSRVLPDFIFMDVNMPHMNGIECLTEIMNDDNIKNIPIVMLTSSVKDEGLILKLGAKALIEKPGDNKELAKRLKQVITSYFTLAVQGFTILKN